MGRLLNFKVIIGVLIAICIALCTVHSSNGIVRAADAYLIVMAMFSMLYAGHHFEKATRETREVDYLALLGMMWIMFWGAEGMLWATGLVCQQLSQPPVIASHIGQVIILAGWLLGFGLHYLHQLRCKYFGQPKAPKI